MSPAKNLKITWTRSQIGCKERHRGTMRALGLKRIRHSVVHKDTPQLRGMLRVVAFMVQVEETA